MLETSAERDTRRVSERDDNTRTELSSRHMYIGCPERLRRLNTSGPLSRRWRGAGGKHAAPPLLRAACAAPCRGAARRRPRPRRRGLAGSVRYRVGHLACHSEQTPTIIDMDTNK